MVAVDLAVCQFERLFFAHVDAHGGVILQRVAAAGDLGRAVHDADLVAQLVDEDDDAVVLGNHAGQLAHRLRHQARLQTHMRCAHVAVDLLARHKRRHRVDDNDIDSARTRQRVRDGERVLAAVGLGHEQVVDVDAELLGIARVKRVLRVDERRLAARLLRLGDDVQGDRGLTGGFRPVNLNDAAARHAADAEREVKRDGAGGNGVDIHIQPLAELHDGALAVVLFDLAERRGQRLLLVGNRVAGILDRLCFFLCDCHMCLRKNGMVMLFMQGAAGANPRPTGLCVS